MDRDFFEFMVPCLAMSTFFLLLFGFIVLMRYLSYKETLALAEKGLVKGRYGNGNGKNTLRWGIAITSVGLALCMGLYPLGFNTGGAWGFFLGFGPWMLVGLIPTFFGLGLVLIYYVTREEPKPPMDDSRAGSTETIKDDQ